MTHYHAKAYPHQGGLFLAATRFFLDCQPISGYNGVVMKSESNKIIYEVEVVAAMETVARSLYRALKEWNRDVMEMTAVTGAAWL